MTYGKVTAGPNKYLNHHNAKNEQALYDELCVENIKMAGIMCYYLPRTDDSIDRIIGETVKTSFNSVYPIEMYFKDVGGFEGGELMSKFGMMTDQSASFIVSKTSFLKLNIVNRVGLRPFAGDLIYIGQPDVNGGLGTVSNTMFEITYVEHETPFWQLGKYNTYTLKCKTFTYSYEKFNTGIPAIDICQAPVSVETVDQGDNSNLNSKALTLRDFSEVNPFGDM